MSAQTTWAERHVTAWTADVDDDSGDEMVHTVCCVDDDTALCSTDVSDQPWSGSATSCVVCCDLQGTSTCPVLDRCSLRRRLWAAWRRRR